MSSAYINASRFHPMDSTERRIFFERYLQLSSSWIPQRFGIHGPLRKFDPTSWPNTLPEMRKYGLIWERSRPSLSGHLVSQIDRASDEWLTLSVECAAFSEDEMINATAFIAGIFSADIDNVLIYAHI